jgi:predicted permease
MTPVHRVELSSRAARTLRALPRADQRLLAHAIDRLAAHGLPRELPRGAGGTAVVAAADHALLCLERDHAIVVVAIDPVAEAPRTTLARAARAPLREALGSRVGRAVADLGMDVRLALRSSRRQPAFVAVTVLTLALGIGGNTAVSGVFGNVYLGELPLRDADRLLRLRNYSVTAGGAVRAYNMSPRDFLQIGARAESLEDVVGMLGHSFIITGEGEPERVSGIFVSEGMSRILGIEPALGTSFTPAQELLGPDAGVVLIGNALWQRRFGADPGAVGESLLLDGRPHVVVGVMPPGFRFPYDAEIWSPGRFPPGDGRSHDLNVLAHRKPGVGLATTRAELDALARALAEEFPDTNRDVGIQARRARDSFISEEDDTVLALTGAVAFLLLITCVNVTNALIARFNSRRHEVGIRAALGAGRWRQARQLLAETGLIFGVGAAGGLLLTHWLSDYLSVLIPEVLRNQLALGDVRLGWPLLGFTLLITAVSALACGGIAATRTMGSSMQQVLQEGARAGGSAGRRRVQRGLVIAEVSLALVLLVGAGSMVQHFRALRGEQLGFETDNLLTLRADLEGTAYDTPERRAAVLDAVEQAIGAVPGVTAVGTTTTNPICCGDWGAPVEFEERAASAPGAGLLVTHRYVTPGLFEAMGIALERGRPLRATDGARAQPVVIIDRRFADHHFPGRDPLGERLRLGSQPDAPWRTIIGVAATIKDVAEYDDSWYLPYHQDAAARGTDPLHFMVRLEGEPEQVVAAVRRAVGDAAPDLALYDARMMSEVSDELVANDRLAAIVASVFALLGTGLAGFGVYGLMSHFVGQQRVEIGTRLALGARPGDVLGMVLRQAAGLTAAGIALGIAASLALSRLMSYFLVGLDVHALPLVAGVAVLLGIATMAATWIPARRAAGVDPMAALRDGG